MPHLKAVESLQTMSLDYISNHLFNFIYVSYKKFKKYQDNKCIHSMPEVNKGKKVEEIVNCFIVDELPYCFHNLFLKNMISKLSNSICDLENDFEDTTKSMILLLYKDFVSVVINSCMTNNIRYLDLTKVTHAIRQYISKKTERTAFANLEEHGNLVPENFFFDCLIQVKSFLPNLELLKIPHFISNLLIYLISCTCESLENLILRCSTECYVSKSAIMNPIAIPLLCCLPNDEYIPEVSLPMNVKGCPSLKILHLPDESENMDDILEWTVAILQFMNSLEDFIGAPMVDVAECLYQNDDDDTSDKKRSFSLRHFHHGFYRGSTWQDYVYTNDADMIIPLFHKYASLFPNIDTLTIYAPSECTLEVVNAFKTASNVTLLCDELFDFKSCFSNCTTIDINTSYEDEWTILKALSDSCPLLQELIFRSFALENHEDVGNIMNFPNLTSLKCYGQQGSISLLVPLLKGCPNLLSLHLNFVMDVEGSPLKDEDVFNMCAHVPKIETFIFNLQSHFLVIINELSLVTKDALIALINNCPNLKKIGHLGACKLSDEDANIFRQGALQNNWDLEIL